jgi:hypothetical protein
MRSISRLFSRFSQSPDGVLWTALAALAAAEAESLVWQRADAFMAGATPGAMWAYQGCQKWWKQQKACPDLRYTSLPNNTTTPLGLVTASTGGLYGATSTARIVWIYIRKTVSASTTAAYLKLFDEGTDAAVSGLTSNSRLVLPLGAVGSVSPGTLVDAYVGFTNGFPLANGLRFALVTLADTFTISSATDGGDGFCITTS